ncbi:MAG: ZPR1 zinc finger domain-containing protein [Candidatus Aenigmarchaeota archaeon]|nr:ZPR1 zinc finger domain-containing protein [Candidatus Aenigmarchaeota archaeon]
MTEKDNAEYGRCDVLSGQECPFCRKKTLTLAEKEMEIPFFGKVFLFSMTCDSCKYRKADLEAEKPSEPCKWTFEVATKEDLNARIVKSADALLKIPHVGSIEPGPDAEGYVTNVEGILTRFKQQIESLKESEEDEGAKKKAKNMLKKIQRVLWGQEPVKIILEDKTGNSAIISDKAQKTKL